MTAGDANPAASFGGAAEEYDRLRPAPSAAALTWLLAGDERVVVDLAAGTGQVSRGLEGRGPEVLAVEPDARMRAVLARRCPGVRVLDGVAEAIPLGDACVDAVLVGSAWHWFDGDRAVGEIARILRPGGRLGVVGTTPDPDVGWVADLFAGGVEAHRATVHGLYVDPDLTDPSFGPVHAHQVTYRAPMAVDDVRALFATHSNYLVADDRERARLDGTVRRVVAARFPGADRIELPMRSWCWYTERV